MGEVGGGDGEGAVCKDEGGVFCPEVMGGEEVEDGEELLAVLRAGVFGFHGG